ncbi:hypothetical protein BDZ45DRAFT_745407 [Acephala macrosclerotiorum]|nr:hypothetical protein BDZ45DRAFT_745407 [Acephala macrosclerotiorum]
MQFNALIAAGLMATLANADIGSLPTQATVVQSVNSVLASIISVASVQGDIISSEASAFSATFTGTATDIPYLSSVQNSLLSIQSSLISHVSAVTASFATATPGSVTSTSTGASETSTLTSTRTSTSTAGAAFQACIGAAVFFGGAAVLANL